MNRRRPVHALLTPLKFSRRTTSVNLNCSNVELVISQQGRGREMEEGLARVCARKLMFFVRGRPNMCSKCTVCVFCAQEKYCRFFKVRPSLWMASLSERLKRIQFRAAS